MAKRFMSCPFSNRACIECAIYRGRHSQVCFASKYRGGVFTGLNDGKTTFKYREENINLDLPDDLAVCNIRMQNIEDREENIMEWKAG
jgi:hypothetical protein